MIRVVFDTNVVISALLFTKGRLSWLRAHWRRDDIVPLVSRATVDEIIRVLSYPRFQLDQKDIEVLLADYLPWTESVKVLPRKTWPQCRERDDQKFVDLAIRGKAKVLVSGDQDLLTMDIGLGIETPAQYGRRLHLGD